MATAANQHREAVLRERLLSGELIGMQKDRQRRQLVAVDTATEDLVAETDEMLDRQYLLDVQMALAATVDDDVEVIP
eukprot:486448-Pyramimonas_sp.AAC.1